MSESTWTPITPSYPTKADVSGLPVIGYVASPRGVTRAYIVAADPFQPPLQTGDRIVQTAKPLFASQIHDPAPMSLDLTDPQPLERPLSSSPSTVYISREVTLPPALRNLRMENVEVAMQWIDDCLSQIEPGLPLEAEPGQHATTRHLLNIDLFKGQEQSDEDALRKVLHYSWGGEHAGSYAMFIERLVVPPNALSDPLLPEKTLPKLRELVFSGVSAARIWGEKCEVSRRFPALRSVVAHKFRPDSIPEAILQNLTNLDVFSLKDTHVVPASHLQELLDSVPNLRSLSVIIQQSAKKLLFAHDTLERLRIKALQPRVSSPLLRQHSIQMPSLTALVVEHQDGTPDQFQFLFDFHPRYLAKAIREYHGDHTKHNTWLFMAMTGLRVLSGRTAEQIRQYLKEDLEDFEKDDLMPELQEVRFVPDVMETKKTGRVVDGLWEPELVKDRYERIRAERKSSSSRTQPKAK